MVAPYDETALISSSMKFKVTLLSFRNNMDDVSYDIGTPVTYDFIEMCLVEEMHY